MVNAGILLIQTVIGATYTSIGTILGLVGSFCGLFLMYLIPISVYLKHRYLETHFPSLAKSLVENTV